MVGAHEGLGMRSRLGICTQRVVVCIPKSGQGNTYNCTNRTNLYTHNSSTGWFSNF